MIIALIQPQSQFIHIERLPIGLPADQGGIEHFPESGKDAAPEVAKTSFMPLSINSDNPPFPTLCLRFPHGS